MITIKIGSSESDDNEYAAYVFCGGQSLKMVMMGKSAVKSHVKGQKHLVNAWHFGNKPPKQQRCVYLWTKQSSTIQGENLALRKKLYKYA